MKTMIVAVMDRQMNAFAAPMAVPTRGIAIRSFSEEVNNPQSPLHKHANDYSLWQLGYFNDETGEMVNEKEKLGEATDYKQNQS